MNAERGTLATDADALAAVSDARGLSLDLPLSPDVISKARSLAKWRVPGRQLSPATPVDVRLFARLRIVGDCWEFNGTLDPSGYGRIYTGGRYLAAHRVAWALTNGPIEDPTLCVCHRCDNPLCCNPAHLFLGTRLENNRDRHAKGRTVMPDPGEARGRANRELTHCLRGHEFTVENTRLNAKGHRKCRSCELLHRAGRNARRRARRRELRAA